MAPKLGKKEMSILAILAVVIIVAAAFTFYPSGGNGDETENPDLDDKDPIYTISHTVMGELFISSTCSNCSYPVQYMADLDEPEQGMITICHMTDSVNGAEDWYHSLRNGTILPDAEFDGRFRSVIGNKSEKEFRNRALECTTRSVVWVNLDVNVVEKDGAYVATVTGQLPSGSIEGNLRLYLIEKSSTSLTTADGRSVHNLVVDYLLSKDVILRSSAPTTLEVQLGVLDNPSNLAVVGAFYVTDYSPGGGYYIHSVQADRCDLPAR